MNPATPAPASLEALILDYNGVIGRQPTAPMWAELAKLAGWPTNMHLNFQQAFWADREAYDAGIDSDRAFWTRLVRGRDLTPGLLTTLRTTDTAMWLHTDPVVLSILRAAHQAGLRQVVLSNAPHPVADGIDATEWRSTLMSAALYSARLGRNKPAPEAYEAALAAAGWPNPATTLFIDDRDSNCQAAQALGISTLHYTGNTSQLARALPALKPSLISAA